MSYCLPATCDGRVAPPPPTTHPNPLPPPPPPPLPATSPQHCFRFLLSFVYFAYCKTLSSHRRGAAMVLQFRSLTLISTVVVRYTGTGMCKYVTTKHALVMVKIESMQATHIFVSPQYPPPPQNPPNPHPLIKIILCNSITCVFTFIILSARGVNWCLMTASTSPGLGHMMKQYIYNI